MVFECGGGQGRRFFGGVGVDHFGLVLSDFGGCPVVASSFDVAACFVVSLVRQVCPERRVSLFGLQAFENRGRRPVGVELEGDRVLVVDCLGSARLLKHSVVGDLVSFYDVAAFVGNVGGDRWSVGGRGGVFLDVYSVAGAERRVREGCGSRVSLCDPASGGVLREFLREALNGGLGAFRGSHAAGEGRPVGG